jgi:hypothetical protein
MASLRLGLRTLNAGDTHSGDFIDQFWIQTSRDVMAPDDIRSIVLEGAYRNCIGDLEGWQRS